MFTLHHYEESAQFIKGKLNGFVPQTLMILGSGLGFLGDQVENPTFIPYGDIPHFRTSTAPGHAGRFVFGTLSGKNVMVMQGRLHTYEGYSAEEVAYPVRVAKLLGATSMIVTNACGGVNTAFSVGELVLIHDVIKFAYPNPLLGPNLPEFGPRFNDMTFTFSKDFRTLAKAMGKKQGLDLKEGVYFYTTGPQYETPAEIKAIRMMGGDMVGMSTVPECLTARHCGMEILGISLVTNMAAGVLDQPLTEEEVLREAAKAAGYFSKLILDFLAEMQ